MTDFEFIMVGCGSSSGTPIAHCCVKKPITCNVCKDAFLNPQSRNRRGNPCGLLRFKNKNVVIDCGKSFKTAMLEIVKKHDDIDSVDAVVLTHAHADACLGLDDLREWLKGPRLKEIPIDVFVRDVDLPDIRRTFPYLVDRDQATGSGHVAKINFHTYEGGKVFSAAGLQLTPIVVDHGAPCECTAFRVGDFVYMSDVSHIPESALDDLACQGGLELLVLDATFITREISSHLNFPQAFDVIRQLRPQSVVFTGLTHEFDYEFWSDTFAKHDASIAAAVARGEEPTETPVVVKHHLQQEPDVTLLLPVCHLQLGYEGMRIQLKSKATVIEEEVSIVAEKSKL